MFLTAPLGCHAGGSVLDRLLSTAKVLQPCILETGPCYIATTTTPSLSGVVIALRAVWEDTSSIALILIVVG
jgi:hypothetical protein